jgi:hypothetical protein
MTATTVSTTTNTTTPSVTSSGRTPLVKFGLGTAVVAGLATSAFAGVVHAAGVPLEIQGEAIPVLGFGQLVVMFSVVGIGIAALCRRSNNARRLFLQVTLALTALSFVPDLTADATTATKLALMASHVVAAAIVIPRLAGRLND